MRAKTEVRTAAGLLAAVFLCAGCASYRGLLVHVRDAATPRPVEGATVFIEPPDPRNPANVADLINPFSPSSDRARTGPDGTVRVRCVADGPVQVRVLAPGFVPQGLYFDQAPDSSDWLCPDSPEASPLGVLAVRVGP